MPLDYASIMRGAQTLVPNIRDQIMQDKLLALQQGQAETQRAATALRVSEAQRDANQATQYQTDLDAALLDGSPQAIQRLMLKYPDMANGIKPAWEALDERQRQTDLTQIGTIYARGNAGDLVGAAQALRTRIEADRAAGAADPADEAILAGLESADPIQQRAALATIGIQLAALTGDKFSETYGKLSPTDAKTTVQKEYEWRVGQFGKAAADRWLATQDESLVAVEPGGSVYRKSDFVGTPPAGGSAAQPGGGDLSSLEGVPSPELGPKGIPATLTPAQYQAIVDVKGKPATDAWMTQNAVSVTVRSVQEAQRLAPGTRYRTPDGREFVR